LLLSILKNKDNTSIFNEKIAMTKKLNYLPLNDKINEVNLNDFFSIVISNRNINIYFYMLWLIIISLIENVCTALYNLI